MTLVEKYMKLVGVVSILDEMETPAFREAAQASDGILAVMDDLWYVMSADEHIAIRTMTWNKNREQPML